MINASQYGECPKPGTVRDLPAAAYKLTANLDNGRGGYTFCMCPGGYVVNASSEPGHLAVNGMSYSGRGGENANSAVIVTVRPEDYPGDGPLAGWRSSGRWKKPPGRRERAGSRCSGSRIIAGTSLPKVPERSVLR